MNQSIERFRDRVATVLHWVIGVCVVVSFYGIVVGTIFKEKSAVAWFVVFLLSACYLWWVRPTFY